MAGEGESLSAWLLRERGRAATLLLRNVSPPGARPGAIVASPSRSDPDYDYHWVRDAGIAVKAILLLYEEAREPAARRRLLGVLLNFVDFSRFIQGTAVREGLGLGEPKFTVQGSPYRGLWARPQDDGPAIRAIALTHLAFLLLDEGKVELVRERLYDAKLPAGTVIKTDLEYLAHRWRETSYDLWEEVRGHHFFTRLLQRKALRDGAALATRLGDPGAADFYLEQASALGPELRRHWDPARGYLVATLHRDGGAADRRSGLDSSVIVAALGGYAIEGEILVEELYPVEQPQLLATAVAQERVFAALYPINAPSPGVAGIAMGRYPEDRYDGYRTDALGNPWVCLTIAFATYHYMLVQRYRALRRIRITATGLPFFERLPAGPLGPGDEVLAGDPRFEQILSAILRRGDTFMERVRRHENPDGSLWEQMNRFTGFQQGAPDLSMGYAAFLLATGLRMRLLSAP